MTLAKLMKGGLAADAEEERKESCGRCVSVTRALLELESGAAETDTEETLVFVERDGTQ